MEWKFGISRCKLLYIGWINNKVLLYSTGNYSQHPEINHNGKEYKDKCVCSYLIHFAIQQKLTQHCKSNILQFLKIILTLLITELPFLPVMEFPSVVSLPVRDYIPQMWLQN